MMFLQLSSQTNHFWVIWEKPISFIHLGPGLDTFGNLASLKDVQMILVPFFEIPYWDRLAKIVDSQYVQVIPRSTSRPRVRIVNIIASLSQSNVEIYRRMIKIGGICQWTRFLCVSRLVCSILLMKRELCVKPNAVQNL